MPEMNHMTRLRSLSLIKSGVYMSTQKRSQGSGLREDSVSHALQASTTVGPTKFRCNTVISAN